MLASTYVLHPSQMSMSLISNQKTYIRASQSIQRSEGQRFRDSEVQRFGSARQYMIQYSNQRMLQRVGAIYSDSKNPFHTNPKCGVRSALPYRMGILLSFSGVIHSTYPWLQDCSLSHVIWAIGQRDMINLKQQYHRKGIFTFEMKRVFVYYQYLV